MARSERAGLSGEVRGALSVWFEPRREAYAWRRGGVRDPWAVLVSEVMLQQTQAARVEPLFVAFWARFPDPASLASAPRAEAIRAWEGLGYHRRALALHAAARAIVNEHGGRVPSEPWVLRSLPGVGPYTAAAVASLAFEQAVAAVDTNVRRVVARFLHGLEPHEVETDVLESSAQGWIEGRDPGRWNETLMDLGREHCRPVPRCVGCPLQPWCRFTARRPRAAPGAPDARPPRDDARLPRRRQPPFAGSNREARGVALAVVRSETTAATLPQIVRRTGIAHDRVAAAVDGLLADGLIERTPAGRFRLPR